MKMDDVISRQKAIDTLADMQCKSDEDGYVWIIRSDAWARIDALPSAEPEQPPEIQDILNYLDTVLHPIISPEHWDVYSELHDMISSLPSAELEQEHTMEEFMYGQELGNPEDGSL